MITPIFVERGTGQATNLKGSFLFFCALPREGTKDTGGVLEIMRAGPAAAGSGVANPRDK